MATITVLTGTDSGSVSMGVINTNFDNLNDDKIEATQTVALTNKTIDADLNTITDLTPTNVKTANKSGLDTSFVTGTKGAVNEVAKWNTDGDLVSTGMTIEETLTGGTLTIPNSKAVKDYVDAEVNTSKEIFFPVYKGADATFSLVGTLVHTQLDAGDVCYFTFLTPSNFTTLTSVDLLIYPDTTETLQMDVVVNIGGEGEAYNTHTTTVLNTQKSVTTTVLTWWNLDTLAGTPFTPMQAGDVVSVSITSDTTLSRVVGLRFRYE